MLKKSICALYALVVVCIGSATIIEKYKGTPYVGDNIYGAWWFVLLWALLAVTAVCYMVKQRLQHRMAVMLLHMSFVVILAGALTTYLTTERGSVNLRKGAQVTSFMDRDSVMKPLPFAIVLKDFKVVNYPGTDAPLDFQSIVTIRTEDGSRQLTVSMNNVGEVDGYRFFQSSYDSDGQGVTLGMYHDPYGISITYTGYLLLLVSIVCTLLSRKTMLRDLYRKAMRPLVMLPLLFLCTNVNAEQLQVVDKEIAHSLGTVNVLYNDRICPVNTVATDFVTKLAGSSSWQGYSADEVFVSWMIYYSPWERQKIIRIKSKEVQHILGIEGQWASFSDFIDGYGGYKLKKPLEDMRSGKYAGDRKGLMEADEKYNVIAMFYQGQMLKMFPYDLRGRGVTWYSPGSQVLPKEMPLREQFFIKQAMDYLTESIVTGQQRRAFEIIAKIKLFQHDMIGDLLPDEGVTRAEIFYNGINGVRWVVFLSLTLSLLLCVVLLFGLPVVGKRWFRIIAACFVRLLLAYLTLLLALRWWIGGHVPVSNGYEIMQFMAWAMLVMTAVMQHRFGIMQGFGTLVASLCLLVAMLAGGTPQITQLMPVLQSPLLSVHVMTVMCAYALFALQVLMGLQAMWQLHRREMVAVEKTTALSRLLLYPAVFLLAVGIFLGAVWANVSWGAYWSWDPKETWALITMMVYAVPLHGVSLSWVRNPRIYHLYMIVAFLSVLTTYFGVNYFLGGLHSYA